MNIITNEDSQNENILDSLDIDALEEGDIELLKNLIQDNIDESMPELFLHSKIDAPPHEIKDVFSSILGDGFHFMDRAKV